MAIDLRLKRDHRFLAGDLLHGIDALLPDISSRSMALPTPMLMTIFCNFGNECRLVRPNFSAKAGKISFSYLLEQPRRGGGNRLLGFGGFGGFCFLRGHNRFFRFSVQLLKFVLHYFLAYRALAGATMPLPAPHFLQYRSFEPSARYRTPTRAAAPHASHTNCTLETESAFPSRAGRLADCSGCGGRACTRGSRPRRPACPPRGPRAAPCRACRGPRRVITFTVSFALIHIRPPRWRD